MAGLILVGHGLKPLSIYEGWHECPTQGVKGVTRRGIFPSRKFGEVAR